ncbi:MAG: hypothetical protein HUK25_04865 [Treponema sp.]|nr:hypothetical protein [Treponema sp.]
MKAPEEGFDLSVREGFFYFFDYVFDSSVGTAVKDGYVLDDITAGSLVEQAFTLEDPHCPHGRPIYTVISREKLFELVKRT